MFASTSLCGAILVGSHHSITVRVTSKTLAYHGLESSGSNLASGQVLAPSQEEQTQQKMHELRAEHQAQGFQKRALTTTYTSTIYVTLPKGATITSTIPNVINSTPVTEVIVTATTSSSANSESSSTGDISTASDSKSGTTSLATISSGAISKTPVLSPHNAPSDLASGSSIQATYQTYAPTYTPLGTPPQQPQQAKLSTAAGLGIGVSVCAAVAFSCFGLLAWKRHQAVGRGRRGHGTGVGSVDEKGVVMEMDEKGLPKLPSRVAVNPGRTNEAANASLAGGSRFQQATGWLTSTTSKLNMEEMKKRIPNQLPFSAGARKWLQRKTSSKTSHYNNEGGLSQPDGAAKTTADLKGRFAFKRRDTGL